MSSVPQRRQVRFGCSRRIGSQVKNAWPSAGKRTPRTSEPASGKPTATESRYSTRRPLGTGDDPWFPSVPRAQAECRDERRRSKQPRPTLRIPACAGVPAVVARGLRRDYWDEPVLRDVSLELEAGETLVVLGPNGAGKSTLLRMLATLLRPTAGELTVLGAELPKRAWKARGRIGYLGHDPLLYADLTARRGARDSTRSFTASRTADERIGELLAAGWPRAAGRPARAHALGGTGPARGGRAAASFTSPSSSCSTSPAPTSTPRATARSSP